MQLDTDRQLLLDIHEEEKIEKICIIKALEMEFAFLDHEKKLFIFALTRYVTEAIGRNTFHTR